MIGIIGAMKIEIDGLRAMLTDAKSETISGIEFSVGNLEGTEVVLAVCGVGKVFAAMCAQTMILHFHVEAVINTGVAGAVAEGLTVGDIAVSKSVLQYDMDTSGVGDPVGMVSGPNMVYFDADERLVGLFEETIAENGYRCLTGPIATGDQFLSDLGKKKWIREFFGAIAAEMEGGSIGQVCYVNHVPFVVIRAISDNAAGNAQDDYAAFLPKAAEASRRITSEVVRKMGGHSWNE